MRTNPITYLLAVVVGFFMKERLANAYIEELAERMSKDEKNNYAMAKLLKRIAVVNPKAVMALYKKRHQILNSDKMMTVLEASGLSDSDYWVYTIGKSVEGELQTANPQIGVQTVTETVKLFERARDAASRKKLLRQPGSQIPLDLEDHQQIDQNTGPKISRDEFMATARIARLAPDTPELDEETFRLLIAQQSEEDCDVNIGDLAQAVRWLSRKREGWTKEDLVEMARHNVWLNGAAIKLLAKRFGLADLASDNAANEILRDSLQPPTSTEIPDEGLRESETKRREELKLFRRDLTRLKKLRDALFNKSEPIAYAEAQLLKEELKNTRPGQVTQMRQNYAKLMSIYGI